MSVQTKASFKKEFLAFFRTKTFLIITCVVISLSILGPLLISGMGTLMGSMSDIYDEMGMDVTDMSDFLVSSSSIGMIFSVDSVAGTSVIVVLLLLNKVAGGEQKKRANIIPTSSGLSSFSYIFPKFIIYPITSFLLAFIAIIAAWPIAVWAFEVNDLTAGGVVLAAVLSGASLMFYVCCHLALGTATGKAGMSAAICISVSIVLPMIFASTDMSYMFNPFALSALAQSSLFIDTMSGSAIADNIASFGFALGIMVITYFIAIFAQNAKRIDNSGNEIEL